ncbi:ligase [Pandoraea morbifera]|uniref:Ligase n=1 Tax=Pandoraea morbifera TaxID=2508300 RepID=A0A5E4U5S5_9BURK|nr:O-antigen ligase family protein [Pandoraea morbifera]VVD93519.1 ligase [Pandoraea morbifera]
MSKSALPAQLSNRPLFAKIFCALILLFPAASLVIPRGGNTVMFLTVALGATVLVTERKQGDIWRLFRSDIGVRVFISALCLPFFAILIVELLHGKVVSNTLDSPVRFVLAVIVFLGLRRLAPSVPKVVDLTFGAGAICAAIMAVYSTTDILEARAESAFLNPIHFGDISLLLGILSVVSIHWLAHDKPWVVVFKIAGALAGGYASWASQSRGGWIALPCLLVVWLFWREPGVNMWRRVMIAVVAVVLLAGAFASPLVRDRFEAVRSDLTNLSQGHPDTSTGIRLELWKAAGKLIVEHPLLGLGAHGYRDAMPEMSASGVLTPLAADLGKGEVHNQILAYATDYGLILGLLAILGVYAGPAYLYLRAARVRSSRKEHRAALMGLMTAVAFAVFGLTVETFNLKVTVAFYATMLAVFAAFAYPDGDPDNKTPAAR